MESRTRPSLVRVIQTDYYAFLSVLLLGIMWGMYAIFQTLNLTTSMESFYGALVLTVLDLLVVIWRYNSVHTLFNNGIELSATIVDLWFFRGRGRVDYTFTCRNHEFISGNDITPNGRTRSLREGDRVTIYVDPENPQRAVIRELFL